MVTSENPYFILLKGGNVRQSEINRQSSLIIQAIETITREGEIVGQGCLFEPGDILWHLEKNGEKGTNGLPKESDVLQDESNDFGKEWEMLLVEPGSGVLEQATKMVSVLRREVSAILHPT